MFTLPEVVREPAPIGGDDEDFLPLPAEATGSFLWAANDAVTAERLVMGDESPIPPTGCIFLTVADADIAAVEATTGHATPSAINKFRFSRPEDAGGV